MPSTTTLIVLLAFIAIALAGHSHQHEPSHGHEAVSYAQVTKFEDHFGHDAHEHNQDEYHGYDHIEHHGNNGHNDHHDDNHGHVQYEFKYGVKDLKTGDVKEQWESRDGHSVKGGYTFKEADGTTRLVHYTSDKKKGFEATVHKLGHVHQDQDHSSHHDHH